MRAFCAMTLGWVTLLACATPPPQPVPKPPARLSVEVLRGGPEPPTASPALALVVDATSSMRAPAAAGVSRVLAARTRALELVAVTPQETSLSIEILGPGQGGGCREPLTIAGSGRSDEAKATLAALEADGEASLAAALDGVAGRLERAGTGGATRVVVVTDLDDRCGGDLCAAARSLAAAGASLDLVVLGDRPTPECLDAIEPSSGAPAVARPAAPTTVRVHPSGAAPIEALADGVAFDAPSGATRVEVALDPPLELGPFPIAPGSLVRVRVLDFPGLRPPVRESSVEVSEAGTRETTPAPQP